MRTGGAASDGFSGGSDRGDQGLKLREAAHGKEAGIAAEGHELDVARGLCAVEVGEGGALFAEGEVDGGKGDVGKAGLP